MISAIDKRTFLGGGCWTEDDVLAKDMAADGWMKTSTMSTSEPPPSHCHCRPDRKSMRSVPDASSAA